MQSEQPKKIFGPYLNDTNNTRDIDNVQITDNKYEIQIPEHINGYKVLKVIGKGGYAVVVLASEVKTGKRYAIKIINRHEIIKSKMFLYLENEIRLSSRFDHPNIVKVYNIIYEEDIIMIIMDYCPSGDLESFLTQGFRFTIEEQLKIAYQILDALNYLHKRGISHRDIKPGNILFDENMNAKLIDFGMSKEKSSSMKTLCGTPFFMAPETVTSKSYDGCKADIWSFGVTLHVLSAFCYPFAAETPNKFVHDVKKNQLDFRIVSPGLIGTIVKYALTLEPKERPTAEDLMNFIQKGSEKFILNSRSDLAQIITRPNSSLPRLSYIKHIANDRIIVDNAVRARNISDKMLNHVIGINIRKRLIE